MPAPKKSSKKSASPAALDQARADVLEQFLADMNRTHPGEVTRLDDETHTDVEAISTGAIELDVALGAGGFPRGRIIELFGPFGGGKTSLALAVAGNCQRGGGNVAFIDAEHALNLELALAMGVNPHTMVIYQPTSGEDAIEMTRQMATSGAFDMIIVDSVAQLTPEAELKAEVTQQHMGLHARLISKFMRIITEPVATTNTMLVLINQVRSNLQAYGAPETSTGGQAIKFSASVRIEVRSSGSDQIKDSSGEVIGQTCRVTVRKNKFGPPHRKAEYDLIFGEGIRGSSSLLGAAEKLGLVTRSGSSYTDASTGERIAIGKENAKTRLDEDAELAARLTALVYLALSHRDVPVAELVDLLPAPNPEE